MQRPAPPRPAPSAVHTPRTAPHLVAALLAAKLAARMQHRQHRLQRGFASGRVGVGGNAAAIIGDRDAACGGGEATMPLGVCSVLSKGGG